MLRTGMLHLVRVICYLVGGGGDGGNALLLLLLPFPYQTTADQTSSYQTRPDSTRQTN